MIIVSKFAIASHAENAQSFNHAALCLVVQDFVALVKLSQART